MQVNGTLVADAGSAQVTLHRTVSVVTLRDSARSTRALRSGDIEPCSSIIRAWRIQVTLK